MNFTTSQLNLKIVMLFIVMGASFAHAGNNEMKDFRFQTCERSICIIVASDTGWLSPASGAFVATGSAQHSVTLQVLENGKLKHAFRGSEVVSQPEIHSMTVDSERSVVLVDINDGTFEVTPKAFVRATRGRR